MSICILAIYILMPATSRHYFLREARNEYPPFSPCQVWIPETGLGWECLSVVTLKWHYINSLDGWMDGRTDGTDRQTDR